MLHNGSYRKNHFKLSDTSIEDWTEISVPILGEHLLLLVKDSHQHRKRIAVRDEQLRLQSEKVFELDHKLKSLTNEINIAHEHEHLSVKSSQATRDTLAGERRRNNSKALVMYDELAKALSDTRKVRQEVVA